MIQGGLGVQLLMIPAESEMGTIGFCDCWSGLHSKAFDIFPKPENFGKDFGGIKELRPAAFGRKELVRDGSLGDGNQIAAKPQRLQLAVPERWRSGARQATRPSTLTCRSMHSSFRVIFSFFAAASAQDIMEFNSP